MRKATSPTKAIAAIDESALGRSTEAAPAAPQRAVGAFSGAGLCPIAPGPRECTQGVPRAFYWAHRFSQVFDFAVSAPRLEPVTFSITDWLARTPAEVLSRNFGVPASTFAAFPKREVYMAKGPVPPPLPLDPAPGSLTGGPLTHRYRLLAQRAETFAGGSLRLVSEREFPISATMTGALLRIKPGGLRELHWHPNADEWQYYVRGRARMTVFGSHGRARTDEFAAGDVGYVPQGYGHYIENVGSDELEVVVVLNNGTYELISITSWMSETPEQVLATNFGVPASTFSKFPKRAAIIPE